MRVKIPNAKALYDQVGQLSQVDFLQYYEWKIKDEFLLRGRAIAMLKQIIHI